jgi:hypothetical protein
MEHAKIILTIEPEAIVTHNLLAATGVLTNATIDTPLRIAAPIANHMVIDERTINRVEIPLAVTQAHSPGLTNQANALLTIEITTGTNATATLNNLIKVNNIKEILNILVNLTHAHNIKSEISTVSGTNIEDKSRADLIETRLLPGTMTTPKGQFTAMIAIQEINAIMNVIIGLLKIDRDHINTIHAGKANMKSERQMIPTTLDHTGTTKMSKSYSKVTTNILIGTSQFKLTISKLIQPGTELRNVKSLDYLTAES